MATKSVITKIRRKKMAGECSIEERGGQKALYFINQDFRYILRVHHQA